MQTRIEKLVDDFEGGRLTRRQLIAHLGAFVAERPLFARIFQPEVSDLRDFVSSHRNRSHPILAQHAKNRQPEWPKRNTVKGSCRHIR